VSRASRACTLASILPGSIALVACRKAPSSNDAVPRASVEPAEAAPVASAPPVEPPWYVGTWSGGYEATLQPVEKMPGAVREWAKDDGTQASGKGTLTLTVDDSGRVSGASEGPLGALAITGVADENALRLSLAPREEASVGAFRGTLVATSQGDAVRGTLKAASGDGLLLRSGAVELRRSP